MTSVYGVTYVGAREQIKRRLEEKGLISDDKLLFSASCYAARVSIKNQPIFLFCYSCYLGIRMLPFSFLLPICFETLLSFFSIRKCYICFTAELPITFGPVLYDYFIRQPVAVYFSSFAPCSRSHPNSSDIILLNQLILQA